MHQNINEDSQGICNHLLLSDPAIRYAGIATRGGDVLASQYRTSVMPLLSAEESQLSVMQALIKAAIRKTMEEKLGRAVYATTVYQKVKRATIAIRDEEGEMLLMVSFEKEADQETIIKEKIIPFLSAIGKLPAIDG